MQEYAEEQAGETGGEEREPFLTEDGYLAVKARESWTEFYRSRGTEWERSLWQEAVEGVKPYLAKGEFLDPSWVSDADEDFPDSGTAVLDCTRWTPEGNFLFFHIWVKVEPGGKYVCDSDYVKGLTGQYAFSEDLVIGHRDPLYEQYRREVEETAGAPNALESEVWPVYTYLSEDWLRTDFPGRPAYGGGWAVSSNLFTFRFPSDHYYCYHDRVPMDMVIPDTETKPYHPRSWGVSTC